MMVLEVLFLSTLQIHLLKMFAATPKHGQCALLHHIANNILFYFLILSHTFCCDFIISSLNVMKIHKGDP